MKYSAKLLLVIVMSFIFNTLRVYAQTEVNGQTVARSPEAEALRQTERMKIDLDLTSTQEKLVYNINLKYEKERHQSNSRTQALERIRSKNEELRKVLSEQQYARLQRKRYDQSTLRRQQHVDEREKPPETETAE
ncbi:MAG: hypothetical protein LBB41_05330 [Prevotellaceae bacterium]|jgi:hypothetical protein|nr:hypothetical protein [Prevotellaceae bacterium]